MTSSNKPRSRTPERKTTGRVETSIYKDNEISQSILDSCNHNIQNEKGNLLLLVTNSYYYIHMSLEHEQHEYVPTLSERAKAFDSSL